MTKKSSPAAGKTEVTEAEEPEIVEPQTVMGRPTTFKREYVE